MRRPSHLPHVALHLLLGDTLQKERAGAAFFTLQAAAIPVPDSAAGPATRLLAFNIRRRTARIELLPWMNSGPMGMGHGVRPSICNRRQALPFSSRVLALSYLQCHPA